MIIPLPITYNEYVPDIMLVDRHVRNLKQAFNDTQVINGLLTGKSDNEMLNNHIQNLILTFGKPMLEEYYDLVYSEVA